MLTNDVPPVGPSRKLSDLFELCCSPKMTSWTGLDSFTQPHSQTHSLTHAHMHACMDALSHSLTQMPEVTTSTESPVLAFILCHFLFVSREKHGILHDVKMRNI